MTAKATLLRHLRELVGQLEEDRNGGACLPDGLLRTLESDLSVALGFMQKRGQRGPNRPAFSHNVAVKVRLN